MEFYCKGNYQLLFTVKLPIFVEMKRKFPLFKTLLQLNTQQ